MPSWKCTRTCYLFSYLSHSHSINVLNICRCISHHFQYLPILALSLVISHKIVQTRSIVG
uniref:Uncharacterized protein n=1 Tax=Rhizophora mucronata TaxID=61149 RepID=A0A2P2N6D1_RHIMU